MVPAMALPRLEAVFLVRAAALVTPAPPALPSQVGLAQGDAWLSLAALVLLAVNASQDYPWPRPQPWLREVVRLPRLWLLTPAHGARRQGCHRRRLAPALRPGPRPSPELSPRPSG